VPSDDKNHAMVTSTDDAECDIVKFQTIIRPATLDPDPKSTQQADTAQSETVYHRRCRTYN